jgi:hypothetical protein
VERSFDQTILYQSIRRRQAVPAMERSMTPSLASETPRALASFRGGLRMARQAVGHEGGETILTAGTWSGLGEVLALAGKEVEAKEAFTHAVELHEQKGNIAGAARTRDRAAGPGVLSP